MSENRFQDTILIRNMVASCCIVLLRDRLEAAGIEVLEVQIGRAVIAFADESGDHDGREKLIITAEVQKRTEEIDWDDVIKVIKTKKGRYV